MNRNGRVFFASILILYGIILILGQLFSFDAGRLFFPLVLISLGLWLVFFSRNRDGNFKIFPIGEMNRRGNWKVGDETSYSFVGDIELDFTNAEFDGTEKEIELAGFVNDIDIFLPEDVGLRVSSSAFVSEAIIYGEKFERIMTPYNFETDNYETAEKKVFLNCRGFVCEINLRAS
mgnify:CR=1 FL=1